MKQSQMVMIAVAVVAILVVSTVAVFVLMKEEPEKLRMATTTSTQDSGLLDYILPTFESKYNCKVDVIAVGSGQALEMGKRGDVDVLMVHSPAAEQTFVAGGYGTNRTQIMYNWFVIVGPDNDPAGTRNATSAKDAFQRIYDNGTAGHAVFVSRADGSGPTQRSSVYGAPSDTTTRLSPRSIQIGTNSRVKAWELCLTCARTWTPIRFRMTPHTIHA